MGNNIDYHLVPMSRASSKGMSQHINVDLRENKRGRRDKDPGTDFAVSNTSEHIRSGVDCPNQ